MWVIAVKSLLVSVARAIRATIIVGAAPWLTLKISKYLNTEPSDTYSDKVIERAKIIDSSRRYFHVTVSFGEDPKKCVAE